MNEQAYQNLLRSILEGTATPAEQAAFGALLEKDPARIDDYLEQLGADVLLSSHPELFQVAAAHPSRRRWIAAAAFLSFFGLAVFAAAVIVKAGRGTPVASPVPPSVPVVAATVEDPSAVDEATDRDENALALDLARRQSEEVFDVQSTGADTVYVDPAGNDSAAGTAEFPLRSISVAVAQLDALGGGTVCVRPGVYDFAAEVALTNPVAVVGTTGNPADAVVTNTVPDRWVRLFRLNHPNALLANLTLARGRVAQAPGMIGQGGGALLDVAGGTISNCVFASCFAHNYYGTGGGAYVGSEAGCVTHCVFTGCTVDHEQMSKGLAVTVNGGGRVEDSLVIGNGGARTYAESETSPVGAIYVAQGVALNCTVVNNASKNLVGILVEKGGAAINCVSVGNANTFATVALVTNSIDATITTNTTSTVVDWGGIAANFDHCATDDAVPINTKCVAGVVSQFFADAIHGNYVPLKDGDLYDAGVDIGKTATDTDLAGKPRIVNKTIDIGCYECQRLKVGGFVIRIR